MNFNTINQITSEQYGFPVYRDENRSAINGVPGKQLLLNVRVSLATSTSYETIAERLNHIWEANQQKMIRGRFYEAEGIYITGPVQNADIIIFGSERSFSIAEDQLDDQIDHITGLCGDMVVDTQG